MAVAPGGSSALCEALGKHDGRNADSRFNCRGSLLASPPCTPPVRRQRSFGRVASLRRIRQTLAAGDLGSSMVGDDCPLDAWIWLDRGARLICLRHQRERARRGNWSCGPGLASPRVAGPARLSFSSRAMRVKARLW